MELRLNIKLDVIRYFSFLRLIPLKIIFICKCLYLLFVSVRFVFLHEMQMVVGVHYKPKTKDWSHRSFFSQQTMSTFQGINYAFQSTKIYIFKREKDTFLKYKHKSLSYSRKNIKSMEYIYSFRGSVNEVKTRQLK